MTALLALALLAPLGLDDALQRAVQRAPEMAAAGVRVREAEAALTTAAGRFDLVGELRLDLSTARQTVRSQNQDQTLDTTRGVFDATLRQPLVWGTQLAVGWANIYTDTDNPFRNCVPGISSEQCYESRLQLTISQPLLRGRGRAVNEQGRAQAEAAGQVARRELHARATELVEATVAAYVELIYAQQAVEIRRQALALAEVQHETSQARVTAGRLAEAELPVVAQAVAERSRTLFAAEQAVADARAALAMQVGPFDAVPDALPALGAWAGGDAAAAAKLAQTAHPDLAILGARIDAQRARLTGLRDATRPRLDLQLVAAQTGIDDETPLSAIAAVPDNDSHYYGAVLEFAFPFANRTAEGQLSEARLAIKRAELERAARARIIGRDAAAARRRLETATRGAALARRVAALSSQTVTAEQRRFELGRTTNLAVLQVQQDAAEAALAVARAEADRLLALAALRRQTGRLLDAHGVSLPRGSDLHFPHPTGGTP